jgi:hypothetical protein
LLWTAQLDRASGEVFDVAYDETRKQTIVGSGRDRTAQLTFVSDRGAALRTVSVPGVHHQIVVDPVSGRVYLFGFSSTPTLPPIQKTVVDPTLGVVPAAEVRTAPEVGGVRAFSNPGQNEMYVLRGSSLAILELTTGRQTDLLTLPGQADVADYDTAQNILAYAINLGHMSGSEVYTWDPASRRLGGPHFIPGWHSLSNVALDAANQRLFYSQIEGGAADVLDLRTGQFGAGPPIPTVCSNGCAGVRAYHPGTGQLIAHSSRMFDPYNRTPALSIIDPARGLHLAELLGDNVDFPRFIKGPGQTAYLVRRTPASVTLVDLNIPVRALTDPSPAP